MRSTYSKAMIFYQSELKYVEDLLLKIISDFLTTTTIRDYINNIIKTVI